MVRLLLLIGAGGFLGSVLRYLAQQSIQKFFDTSYPLGTMFVNIVGCFVIGIMYSVWERGSLISGEWRLFFTVGLCGGFTTFSSFALDNLNLLKDWGILYLALYTGGSVFLGVLAAFLGIHLVRML